MIGKAIAQQGSANSQLLQNLNIESHYKNFIKRWANHKFAPSQKKAQFNYQEAFYQNQFKSLVYSLTKLNIILDKRAYSAIINLLKQIEYLRIRNYRYKCQQQMEDVDKIVSVAEDLAEKNFITRSMLTKIKQITKPDNSLQAALYRIIQEVEKDKIIFSDSVKIQQIWEKHFSDYSFEAVSLLIAKNLDKLDRKCVQKIFNIYKRKFDSDKTHSIVMNVYLHYNKNQNNMSQFLQNLANLQIQSINQISHHLQKQSRTVIDLQLNTLYQRITISIREKYKHIAPKFQLFGSYRSGFYIKDSDFDITIFCRGTQKAQNQNQIYCDVLGAIQSNFEAIKQNYVQSIEYIARARVPVLKLQLKNKIVKNVDIVLNNAHGVQNSRFLQSYSADPSIKQFGVIIKKWAKSNRLIDGKKFSSYCFIMMMLYYLIKKGKLQPAKRFFIYQKKIAPVEKKRGNRFPETQTLKTKIQPSPKLQKQIQLYEDFMGFLQFYSEKGQFFKKGEIVCLLQQPKIEFVDDQKEIEVEGGRKNCIHMHKTLAKSYFLINVHDAFDDTNPGRMNKQGKRQFFSAIQETISMLNQKDKKTMKNIFDKNI